MAARAIFTDGEAETAYSNVRAARNEYTSAGRRLTEELWELYEPYADAEFLTEIRTNFESRFWEMYLAVTLISAERQRQLGPEHSPGPHPFRR